MEEMYGFTTAKVGKRLSRLVASFLRPYDITPEQWTVLKKVSESDRITQKQLAIKADKDQATLTKILDLLEKSGHLQRIRNPEDRRSYYIQQTEKGMALQEEITGPIEDLFKMLTAEIDEADLAAYFNVLQQLEKKQNLFKKRLDIHKAGISLKAPALNTSCHF